MSDLRRINFQLEHGYVPKELNYTNYYNSPEFLTTKYTNCMNIPCFDAVVEDMAEQSNEGGNTP